MIARLLRTRAQEDGERPFMVGSHGELTYAKALREAEALAPLLGGQPPGFVFLRGADPVNLAVALIACDVADRRSCIIGEESTLEETGIIIEGLGGSLVVTDDLHEAGPAAGILSRPAGGSPGSTRSVSEPGSAGTAILTSGTTGTPKAALYTWDRLVSQARAVPGERDSNWLLAHPLNHLAGLQVLVHTLKNASTLVVPDSHRFTDLVRSITEHHVDSVSSTPTFWRNFVGRLNPETAATLSIRRITLGGEATTAGLLNRLRELFPDASITQIFGTTELGACFSVKDGKPGFPAEYLERPVGNVALRVIDDRLYIKAAQGMVSYANSAQILEREGDWVATGDLVERVDDRVYFRSRTTGIISVGGINVYPLKVEELVLSVPGVKGAHVFGKPNPITGQIVALDIEVEEDHTPDEVIARIRQAAQRSLNRYEQPRDIQVTAIETRNEKVVRRTR